METGCETGGGGGRGGEGVRGAFHSNLLVMAAFTKAPKVLWGQALDALGLNAKSIKSLVRRCANGDVLSLQRYFAFIPSKQ